MADQPSAAELLPVPVFWALPTPPVTGQPLPAAAAPAQDHACHFPAADSGRELRALIESFLL